MRKFMIVAIPIITLSLFIIIMLSGEYLKRPMGKDDDVPEAIMDLMETVQAENWDEVEKKTDKLEAIWKRIIFRVQFSSERDEINYFSTSIARLRGSAMANDKSGSLVALSEAYSHWEELGN